MLRKVYANDSVRTPERVRRYAKFMDLPGAHHSFAETAEQIVPPDAAELEAQLKTISVPVLAIWGEEDEIVPLRQHDIGEAHADGRRIDRKTRQRALRDEGGVVVEREEDVGRTG